MLAMNAQTYDAPQIANISSARLETILDALIEPALVAINETTGLAREMISSVLVTVTTDIRRQPARRDGFQAAAVRYMLVGDSASLLAIKINHDYAIDLCNKFLEHTMDVDRATMQCLVGDSESLALTGLSLSATNTGRLFTTRRTVQHALKEFLSFRSMIANKYLKRASLLASVAAKTRVGTSYKTAFGQAQLGVLTGIDRYSSTRGALASYVDLWIKQFLFDKSNLQEGVAFDIDSDNVNGSRNAALKLHGTQAVQLDDILLESLASETGVPTDGGEHTRALARLKHLRPVLIACGASLAYKLSGAERSQLVRVS